MACKENILQKSAPTVTIGIKQSTGDMWKYKPTENSEHIWLSTMDSKPFTNVNSLTLAMNPLAKQQRNGRDSLIIWILFNFHDDLLKLFKHTPAIHPMMQSHYLKNITFFILELVFVSWFNNLVIRWSFYTCPLATDSVNQDDIQSIDSLVLDLSTLRSATDNFSESNKLGQGGFGSVYKVPVIHS
jgi:hypothetical protein